MTAPQSPLIHAARGRPGNDPIFALHQEAVRRAASGESIVDATIGTLSGEDGEIAVLPSVLETLGRVHGTSTAGYAPVAGRPAFLAATIADLFGDGPLARQAVAVATPGGTGAVYQSVVNFLEPGQTLVTSSYHWGPYPSIARNNGRDAETFTMFRPDGMLSRDLDIPGTAANILPSSAFPGDVLEFDFRNRLISVYDGRPDRPTNAYHDSVPYKLEGGLMYVEVRINGRKGRALIDTGSNLTYVNSVFADLAKLSTNLEKTQLLQGATGGDESVRIATARRVKLADFNFEGADLFVTDPELFTLLGLKDEPVMVIGLDFLSEFKVQFDRRRSRIILSLPDSAVQGVSVELMARDTRF
jgi:predicted aspartyl protease